MESKPTFEQAQLHLQVYEMRREPRLRQARDWFFSNYFANTFDEAMRIAAPGTEGGTNYMMVVSYWEQACALLNYGLLHEDLFFETSGACAQLVVRKSLDRRFERVDLVHQRRDRFQEPLIAATKDFS